MKTAKFSNDREMLKGIMKKVKKLPKSIQKSLDVDFRRDQGTFEIKSCDDYPEGFELKSKASSEAMLKYIGWKAFLEDWNELDMNKRVAKISSKIAVDYKKAISMNDFWKVVDKLDWKRDHNWKRIKKMLLENSNKEMVDSFKDAYDRYYQMLDQDITKWRKENDIEFGLGDDGYWDLLSHIIGLGKKKFYEVSDNPEVAYEMAQKSENPENFSYGIPDDKDWKDVKTDSIDKKALLKAWQTADNELGVFFRTMRDDFNASREVLETINDSRVSLANSVKEIQK